MSGTTSAGIDSRITLHKLEVFCLTVELGGVAPAAERLLVPQPAVSAHLRSLSERLGVALFRREGRRLQLTDHGTGVYQWAAATLDRTRNLSATLDGLAAGRLGDIVVAASMSVGSYMLPPVLTAFKRDRPEATLGLNVFRPEEALTDVEMGRCHFAVVISDGRSSGRSLTWEHLGDEPVVLVAAPGGEPDAASILAADLAHLPLVTPPSDGIRRAMVDQVLRKAGVELQNSTIELGHPEAMKRAIASGAGAGLLFRTSVRRELAAGTLREVPIDDLSVSAPVFVVRRRAQRLTPLQQEVLDVVRAGVAPMLSQAGIRSERKQG